MSGNMEQTYQVKMTTQAIEELDRAVQYIANDLQQPEIADHWLDTMQCELRSLSHFPWRYPLVEEEPFAGMGIHKMKVKNYLVYYIIQRDPAVVWITAIVYAKRSQIPQLFKMNLEETE